LSDGTYLFNEEAKRTYGLKAGDPIRLDWGDNKDHQVRQGPSHNIFSDKDGERLQLIPERVIFQVKRTYGLKAGDPIRLDWGDLHRREKIAGFVPDLKYNSFREALSGTSSLGYC